MFYFYSSLIFKKLVYTRLNQFLSIHIEKAQMFFSHFHISSKRLLMKFNSHKIPCLIFPSIFLFTHNKPQLKTIFNLIENKFFLLLIPFKIILKIVIQEMLTFQ